MASLAIHRATPQTRREVRVLDVHTLVMLLDRHAPFAPCEDVPALSSWSTDDEVPLWEALEREHGAPLGVPYFAIAWPSARVVARALLEAQHGPLRVRGLRVADVGCGSGVVACAAMRAGAAHTVAIDVDPLAVQAAHVLAERHGVRVAAQCFDPLAHPERVDADVVLCADLVSRDEQRAPFAHAVAAWRARGARVILADSGRPFFDPQGLSLLQEHTVRTSSRVDGTGSRTVRVWAEP